ncbi:hypothetical protein [Moraxella lacunata]|uniref:hypothetical protein n=1 Tax=Moraxella lacunata TaxID=477 RepID=UPI003EDF697C
MLSTSYKSLYHQGRVQHAPTKRVANIKFVRCILANYQFVSALIASTLSVFSQVKALSVPCRPKCP